MAPEPGPWAWAELPAPLVSEAVAELRLPAPVALEAVAELLLPAPLAWKVVPRIRLSGCYFLLPRLSYFKLRGRNKAKRFEHIVCNPVNGLSPVDECEIPLSPIRIYAAREL